MLKVKKSDVQKMTTSALWSVSVHVADKIIGFISLTILARLLTPNDFGLVAIAVSVIAFADLLNSFGLDWALIRHPNPTNEHYNTAWTLRVILGLITTIILILMAPLVSMLLKQPALKPLISVLALTILIEAFENIGTVDFRRQFYFDREFFLRFWPKIISFVIGISIAYTYRSYWALVIGSTSSCLTVTLLSYPMHEFRPRFSLKNVQEFFSFSIWVLITNILNFFRNYFANLFIGYLFGSSSTGIYSISNEISRIATSDVAHQVDRASFSRYAQYLDQPNSLEKSFITTISVLWMLILPISTGIAAISDEIVAILLGQQWLDATNILRILVIATGLSIITNSSRYVFYAQNITKTPMMISVYTFAVFIILLIILTPFLGLMGIVWAHLFTVVLALPLNFYLLYKIFGFKFTNFLPNIWRPTLAAGGMLMILQMVFGDMTFSSSFNAILSMTINIPIGILTYILILFLLWHASGRPEGAERFILNAIRKSF